ncbi:hypothetical protein B0T25DRAFT_585953 [Lasiosphaeria hispida]|uniref:Uncharacterized protein n=1 Tax=Lasiosphaeria hispida TaxID=260671 RepID=A0AAJ0H726_9PEZI|nr:hypothetical protein B0T25DRAFT_585953 [Lasiosphaeria hispida]
MSTPRPQEGAPRPQPGQQPDDTELQLLSASTGQQTTEGQHVGRGPAIFPENPPREAASPSTASLVSPQPISLPDAAASPAPGRSATAPTNSTNVSGSQRRQQPPQPQPQPQPQLQPSQSQSPTSTTSPTPVSPSIPPAPALPTRKLFLWRKHASQFSVLVFITCIFVFVSAISLGANSPDWLLARLSPTSGILLLSFMSKLSDWGLGGATSKAWEMIQWGPLLRGPGGSLLSFLTIGSQLEGWVEVLCRKWTWLPRYGLVARPVGSPGFWALLRLVIWVAVQFPGLIIMSVVETQTEYLASNWTTVSGGIGVFDPSLIFQQIQGPSVSNYVFTILRDQTFSKLTDPVTDDCKTSPACVSYLLTGGLTTLAPLPFLQANVAEQTAYIAEDVPSYHIDAWDLMRSPTNFSGSGCRLYGATDANLQGFYLCAKNDDNGAIVTGYAPCGLAKDCQAVPRSPNATVQLNIWITQLSVYRRKVTFAADRRTSILLRADGASQPLAQHIAATDFLLAFDKLLCSTNSASNLCDPNQPNFLLTDAVATLLSLSITQDSSHGLEVLQNLFAVSLYLFTSVWVKQIGQSTPRSLVQNALVGGLPDENYFPASLARPVEFIAPAPWTVVAYLVSGAVLLVLCFVAATVSAVVGTPEVSSFPVVDAVRLKVRESDGREFPGGVAGIFAGKKADADVMSIAARLTVRLEDQAPALVSPV